ncbi:MAG: biotin-dependent carboxyltransferase family protein [Proteobacteria bacterium]|nr:biotin-dependent carboxyltransferase family protein [Pseudomonadota bacterium]
MSTIEIIEAGPYTSIQDRGRFGEQRYGLGPAGAMDRLSLGIANVLVGQAPGDAAIEIGPLPMTFRVTEGVVRIAVAGAVRGMTSDGRALSGHETILLNEGDRVQMRAASQGVFTYLAFEGGIRAEPVLGSLSVHARAGIGCPYPRALQPGDRITVGGASTRETERLLPPLAETHGPLRVVLGPQDEHFTPAAIAAFLAADWTISSTSDRMGFRLEGPKLEHAKGFNIISDGIAFGAIQVPGSGQPLVLMADRGTTGGYPKIAVVISADLPRLAQMPVGSKIRFAAVSVAVAQLEARAMAVTLAGLKDQVREIGGGELSSAFLLGANLAGGAVDALE